MMQPNNRRKQALAVLNGCKLRRPSKHKSRKREVFQKRRDATHISGESWSQCAKKASYSSRRMAERVAERILAERGVELRVYQCDKCNGYHLSKKFKTSDTPSHNNRLFDTIVMQPPPLLTPLHKV